MLSIKRKAEKEVENSPVFYFDNNVQSKINIERDSEVVKNFIDVLTDAREMDDVAWEETYTELVRLYNDVKNEEALHFFD